MSSAGAYTWQRSDGSTGRTWRARWIGADGRSKQRRGFDRKRDAEQFAAHREAEARHGGALGDVAPSGRTTLAAWSATWLAGLDVRESTRASYDYALRRILPTLGERTLAGLRPSELAMVLRAALEDGLPTTTMPARTTKAMPRGLDPAELLAIAQVWAWGAAMPPLAREMPVLAASTGLRQGELLGLRLPQVDFLRRQVRVVEQLVTPRGPGVPTWGPPKTPAGVRTVPLTSEALEALARHLERQPPVDGEPLFRSPRGLRWRRAHFRETWHAARRGRAAGLGALARAA